MSLILEALRKSEAERRRGQAPDLFGQAVPARASHPTASHQWSRLSAIGLSAIAAALIAALLILLWWPRTGADSTRPAAEARGTEAGVAAAVPNVVPAGPRSAPASAATSATVASATAPPARVAAPVAAAMPRTTVPAAPIPAPLPAAARIEVEPPAPAAAATPAVAIAAAARPAAEPATLAATTATAPIPLPPAVTEPAPAAARFTGPDVPLRLAELSSEERQQLPTLKVSVHMWAPDGAHRFAIIDGTRVHEGDRVGDATIEAIEQDGVLLAWRGRRIRLPIR